MNLLDLVKATVICGSLAYLVFNFPTVGTIIIIATLSLIWLAYAHRAIAHLRRR